MKVQKSLNALESGKDATAKEASDLNEDAAADSDEDDDKKKGGNMGIIIGVVAAALAIGGIVYCKCNNKCCFADKEGDMEGGATDKTLFKKEVKSKNSHKRHTKENLMPAFKVAEEEA